MGLCAYLKVGMSQGNLGFHNLERSRSNIMVIPCLEACVSSYQADVPGISFMSAEQDILVKETWQLLLNVLDVPAEDKLNRK